jgi:FKBP-type peptidyl-prolyl cis-trans isomerase
MRFIYFSLLFTGLLITSCNGKKKDNYQLTDSGLRYRFIEQMKGRKPQPGDIMRVHLLYRDVKGRVLYNSNELGDAFVLQLTEPSFKGGLEEGFALMGEGDSAIFLLPADSVFDKMFKRVMPPSVNKGDLLSFEVRLKKIMKPDEYKNEQKEIGTKRKGEEATRIDLFLLNNNIKAEPVEDGVWFVKLKEGKGLRPVPGDSVYIHYTGKFLDGSSFDGTGGSINPLSYILGEGTHLDAWEKAVAGMNEGAVVRLVLRSDKAYGEAGFGPVPPNTPVTYDIELIRVVKLKRPS